ncbi:MAG: Rrf2 family transcriptional regulator [bacterium]
MRISARCEYACKALLELSLHWPNNVPLSINTISHKQKIPSRYLVQILMQLKRIQLITSIRGKEGGYLLNIIPEEIRLGYVIREIQGPFIQLSNKKSRENDNAFFPIWKEIEQAIGNVLDTITFQDICNKIKDLKKAIIYQI